jgi:hypothetical protein
MQGKGKGKAIPLQALTDPENSKMLSLPDFKINGTWKWQGCQPYAPAAFTPRKYKQYKTQWIQVHILPKLTHITNPHIHTPTDYKTS